MSQPIAMLLAQEVEAVEAFLKILKDEHEVLKHGPVDRLPGLGEQKMALVSKLNALESQRDILLGRIAGESAASRMNAWLAITPEADPLRPHWDKLLELAREARRMHQLNTEILDTLLNRTSEAIKVLTRQQKGVALYGSDGQATAATGSRIVDSA